MGNRAVIAFGPNKPTTVGVYLHWNGGRASVEGFLAAARDLGIRGPIDDYGVARFTQIVGNWFGGSLSVGVGTLKTLDCDNGDNGLYLLGDGWQIVGRKYYTGGEEVDAKKTAAIHAECLALNAPLFLDSVVRDVLALAKALRTEVQRQEGPILKRGVHTVGVCPGRGDGQTHAVADGVCVFCYEQVK